MLVGKRVGLLDIIIVWQIKLENWEVDLFSSLLLHTGHDESCGKGMEGQPKPVFLLSNSDIGFNPIDYNHSVVE